jgi:hypothetical protein
MAFQSSWSTFIVAITVRALAWLALWIATPRKMGEVNLPLLVSPLPGFNSDRTSIHADVAPILHS